MAGKDIPERCNKCGVLKKKLPYKNCLVCNDLGVQESMLCELNRNPDNSGKFACYSFLPLLRLMGSTKGKTSEKLPIVQEKEYYFEEVLKLHGDPCQGKKGSGCNCMHDSPGLNHANLKFHILITVDKRRKIFKNSDPFVGSICNILADCDDLAGGRAYLVWLAPEHIHLYLETNGDKSIDVIVSQLKQAVSDALKEQYQELADLFPSGALLWSNSYFVETIG
jgi:REP element-mobilizing transposase RayT